MLYFDAECQRERKGYGGQGLHQIGELRFWKDDFGTKQRSFASIPTRLSRWLHATSQRGNFGGSSANSLITQRVITP